jgi:hypothetical protein
MPTVQKMAPLRGRCEKSQQDPAPLAGTALLARSLTALISILPFFSRCPTFRYPRRDFSITVAIAFADLRVSELEQRL